MLVVNNFFVKFTHKVFCRRLNQRTYAKESARVFIGLKKQLFYRFAPNRGYFFRCIRNQERCASFTPVRHGRHIRRVGFKQKPVLRHKSRDLCPAFTAFLNVTAPPRPIYIPSFIISFAVSTLPEKQCTTPLRTVLFKQTGVSSCCFAVVNYNGQRQLICKHKLFFEYLELFFAASLS